MKRSMELRAQGMLEAEGGVGRFGGTKAQWMVAAAVAGADSGHCAPASIQRRMVSISAGASGFPPMGMRAFQAQGEDVLKGVTTDSERLSDGQLHWVGTSPEPLKTPSLRGVSKRLPLMHDGCASTLRARFDLGCGGGDQHGVTSHLDADQIDALVSYLETL